MAPLPESPPHTAVTLRELGMRFKGTPKGSPNALEAIEASIPSGNITGLVGPDAAGKTTLMRILAGLMHPTAGEARVFGAPPAVAAAQGHIGYMPQRFGLYEDLSVYDNLKLHARLRGLEGEARDALFARLLDFTSLASFTARLAGRLSGGMKQKLGIACALLGSPRLLLLDEPGVGVDPQSRRELWRMVQDLCGAGMTIVWSTAYLDEAERCPHVVMLDAGRTLYVGPPRNLTSTAEGRVFLLTPGDDGAMTPNIKDATAPNGDGTADHRIPGDNKALLARWLATPGVDDALIQGRHVRVVLRKDAPESLRQRLRLQGGIPTPPRLEDAYMSALGGIEQTPSPFADTAADAPGTGVDGVNSVDDGIRIDAHGLCKHFGDFVAAQDISFQVRAGQIFGLLGPNGAGKSTTFRMLCGLSRPTAGTCAVDGVDLLSAGSKARSRLGYMAQKFSLYPDIPVIDNIHIFADLYGLSRARKAERIPQLVNALGLQEYLSSVTGSLPLGQKQRLALLCATLHNPPVLFLDEPTSGVDARTRRDFWKHITAMTRAGAAVLVTTHFMEEAEYCDHIALVYQGRIISGGTPDELKAHAPRTDSPAHVAPPDMTPPDITLEDAFIAYIEQHHQQASGKAAP